MRALTPINILVETKMISRFLSALSRNTVPPVSSFVESNIYRYKSTSVQVSKPKEEPSEDGKSSKNSKVETVQPQASDPSADVRPSKYSEPEVISSQDSKSKLTVPKTWNTPEYFKKERLDNGLYPEATLGNMQRGLTTEELKQILNEPENLKEFVRAFPREYKKAKEFVKEKIRLDPLIKDPEHYIKMLFTFDTEEKIENFNVTCDADHDVGYSNASLTMTKTGSALFSGYLCQKLKPDGQTKRAGYVNMTCKRPTLPFGYPTYLNTYHDFEAYNHFVFKVRGDGRTYAIILHTPTYYEDTYSWQYTYFLYTRGGPYWQISKLPFSKFFFSPDGRVAELQELQGKSAHKTRISRIGITLADGVEGPFNLEIDYIGLQNKSGHFEEFAYESYQAEHYGGQI